MVIKWQSGVTPRLLTESDKGTDAQPTVTEIGKETERDLNFLPGDTIIASVLSSFSFSLFIVIEDLITSMHLCSSARTIERSASSATQAKSCGRSD